MLRGLFIFIFLFAPCGARASAVNTGAGQIADAAGFTAAQYGAQIAQKEKELAGIPDTPENKEKRDKLKAEIQDLKNKKATAEMLQQQATASQGNATKDEPSKAMPPQPTKEDKKEENKAEKPKQAEVEKIKMPGLIEAQVNADVPVKSPQPVAATAGPATGKADPVNNLENQRTETALAGIAARSQTAVNSVLSQMVDLESVDAAAVRAARPTVTVGQRLQNGAPGPQPHRAPPNREAQVERGWAFRAR